jgi:CRISPR-associated protein Cas2
MWMLVMFDLPVGSKAERSEATKFRTFLLDEGFEMNQYSVYLRFCVGKEQLDRRLRQIRAALPSRGQVNILSVTDKQFEKMAVFRSGVRSRSRKNPSQLDLF